MKTIHCNNRHVADLAASLIAHPTPTGYAWADRFGKWETVHRVAVEESGGRAIIYLDVVLSSWGGYEWLVWNVATGQVIDRSDDGFVRDAAALRDGLLWLEPLSQREMERCSFTLKGGLPA